MTSYLDTSHSNSSPIESRQWWDSLSDDAFVQVRKRDVTDKLVTLMRKLGQTGIHITVRYDPLRADNHFTVIIGPTRAGDGNDPVAIIRQYLNSKQVI